MAETTFKYMRTFLRGSNYEDTYIGRDMRCTICTKILINACKSICGCRYCLECVISYLNGRTRFCPGNTKRCKVQKLDNQVNIGLDYEINKQISNLIVSCRYSCGYRSELRNMEEHEKTCPRQPVDCPFVNVGCRETRLVTDRINEHLVGENESHVRLLMMCIDRLESEIASMKRDTVELRSEMAEMRLAREIDEARARETNKLVDQIKQEVANLRNENQLAKEDNHSLKAELEKYRTEYVGLVATTEWQLAEMRTGGQTQAREMELLTEKYSRSEEKLGELERQTLTEKEEQIRKIDEIRHKEARRLANIEKRMSEIGINPQVQNWGEFVWLIDEWAANQKSARDGTCTQIFSDPFFSHMMGYKMCLSVDPDGYGIGKGTHLCVRFSFIQGSYDNILSWPFKHDVTLSIINQNTGMDHVSHTFKFNDLPNHINWNKPTMERNEPFYHCKLIELAALSSTAGLCWDDKLLIKCTVK